MYCHHHLTPEESEQIMKYLVLKKTVPQLFFKVPLLPLFQDKGPFFSNNVGSGSTGIGSGV